MDKASTVYDLTALKEACNNNDLFIKKMITIYLESMPKDLLQLKKSIALKDWKNIAFWSHKMKASINGMNIHSLKESIKKIEELSNALPTQESIIEIQNLFITTNEILQHSFIQLKKEITI